MHYRMILLAALATLGGLANQSTPAQNSPGADTEFRALLADEWQNRMINDPLYATQMGVRNYDDRLPRSRRPIFRSAIISIRTTLTGWPQSTARRSALPTASAMTCLISRSIIGWR